ncbi:hypothetical protein F4558_002108 [Micromonospora profundi]|nr:hypothetical protein [Micromonospora profundi]
MARNGAPRPGGQVAVLTGNSAPTSVDVAGV